MRIGTAQTFFAKDAVYALGIAGKQFQHGLKARQQRGFFGFVVHTRLRAVCVGRRAAIIEWIGECGSGPHGMD